MNALISTSMTSSVTISTLIPASILLVAVLAVGLRVAQQRRLRAGGAHSVHEALRCCDRLLRLLSSLQQHRGLSSGWLAGDKSFAARMLDKRAEIDVLFAELAPFVAGESLRMRPCLSSNDLALFRFNWRTLVDELAHGNVEQNIARHSQSIVCVLDWLAAVGEARVELAGGENLSPGLVRNYAHRLPALSECLGQARAIGSSVAARHACSAVARVRLMFLVARAETLLEQASAANDAGGGGALAAQAKTAVGLMARTVREELLTASPVSVSADAYFALSTRAVDAVLAWAGDCGLRIDRELAADPVRLPSALALLSRG